MSHDYAITLTWTGNLGSGTSGYAAYSRNHTISAEGKPTLEGSADPAFRGDESRWNPEEMFLASVSACHKLWFLHLASDAGIVVASYQDHATATLELNPDGSGQMTAITLSPRIIIETGEPAAADALHKRVSDFCFIARSITTPITYAPNTTLA